MSSTEVQIWDNAAFDNEEFEDLAYNRISWGSLKSTFGNPKGSFESASGKENQGSSFLESQISYNSSNAQSITPFKPVNRIGVSEKSRNVKGFKKGREEISVLKGDDDKETWDGREIDKEIEEIECEISRLSSRLEVLRLEKNEISVRNLEKRGRMEPAKFMEQKQCVKKTEEKKKINDPSDSSVGVKIHRRGVSLGPAEIASCKRRGMSMGPSEILGSAKLKRMGKQEIITPVQSRRKSCFWKLEEIEEEKVSNKGTGKGSSLSPKSRKVASKAQVLPRQAVTTVASRKGGKKEEVMILSSIQPKKLFKEGEQIVSKKPLRPGRVVASRYNQNTNQASAVKKRTLPESDKEDDKRFEKKISVSVGKFQECETDSKNLGTETRVKKQWEIPREIVVHSKGHRSLLLFQESGFLVA